MTGSQGALQPTGERYDFVSLCLATTAELETVMRRGLSPDLASLVGWEFRAYVVSEVSELLQLRKHKKVFSLDEAHRDPTLGIIGYDLLAHPTTLGEPWIERTRGGEPLRAGSFDAYPVTLTERDNKYPNGVLLNYGLSPWNHPLSPLRLVRSYLVQVYDDDPDLFVGKLYVTAGPMRLPVTYFALERHAEVRQ